MPVQARPWLPPGCTRGQRTGIPHCGVTQLLAESACTAWSPLTLARGRTVINDISRCLIRANGTLTPEASDR